MSSAVEHYVDPEGLEFQTVGPAAENGQWYRGRLETSELSQNQLTLCLRLDAISVVVSSLFASTPTEFEVFFLR